jgi:hypothetical protein
MFKLLSPDRGEINEHTSKIIVGLIAISLASFTNFFSETPLQSISASYHEGGWSRDIFVGFLFAISTFLLAFNGRSTPQMVLSKMAALAAMGVAMFPCKGGSNAEVIPYVHGTSAAVMFLILAFFCYTFFRRAREKGHLQAMFRAYIYAICGITIVAFIFIIVMDNVSGGFISSKIGRLTFYGEKAGLIAFGIAWLSASRFLPLLTRKDERLSIFSDHTGARSVDAG